MQNAVALAKEKFGKLDVAVNCAGIGGAARTFNFKKKQPYPLEEFSKIIKVSTHTAVHLYIRGLHSTETEKLCKPREQNKESKFTENYFLSLLGICIVY